jgi:hypothetical protein
LVPVQVNVKHLLKGQEAIEHVQHPMMKQLREWVAHVLQQQKGSYVMEEKQVLDPMQTNVQQAAHHTSYVKEEKTQLAPTMINVKQVTPN